MNTDGTLGAVDSSFEPRGSAWFRTRLALRLAVPPDRGAQFAALKLAGSAALAAPPVTIVLIAPARNLTLGAAAGLCCAALPGGASLAWTAAGLRESRSLAAHGLRQAGAEQRIAWLLAAARLTLFAGAGALTGALLVALVRVPLGAVLPQHSPLRGMVAASAFTWLLGVTLTVVLAIGGALLAGSPYWAHVRWTRLAAARAAVRRRFTVLTSPRGARPPR